jgi:hypothetical protein
VNSVAENYDQQLLFEFTVLLLGCFKIISNVRSVIVKGTVQSTQVGLVPKFSLRLDALKIGK